MVRRAAALLVAALVAALLLLLPAPPAQADGAVLAGTYSGTLRLTHSWQPGAWGFKPGPRTFSFGRGCAIGSACSMVRDGTAQRLAAQAGGSFGWSGTFAVACQDNVTGERRTDHGFDYSYEVHLRPAGTTTRDGVTYVTALTGTYQAKLAVNAVGRSLNCLVNPRRVPVDTESAVYVMKLVPLKGPDPTTSTPPLGIAPTRTAADGTTTETMAPFTLPRTDRQRESARAVAAGHRSSVPGALVTVDEAVRTVGDHLPRDLLLVALLGLLIVFPAQLFNSTYEENHERIDRQLARLGLRRRRTTPVVPAQGGSAPVAADPAPPPRARRLLVFLACAVAGTVLGGLLDPKFGATTASYALMTGIFVAVVVTVLLVALTGRLFRSATHHEHAWYLRAIPSALLIAVVCVVVSRLTHFEPGYLYGVVGGAVFAIALDGRSEGRAEVVVGLMTLLVALGAWVAFGPVADAANAGDASFLVLSGDAILASLFIGALEGLLFGMVPLRFLPGARIKGWSWVVWGVMAAVVLYVFVHVLLLPESGYLGRSTAASADVTIALFIAFAVVSVAFWGWFKLRPTPPSVEPAEPVPTEAGVPVTAGEPS